MKDVQQRGAAIIKARGASSAASAASAAVDHIRDWVRGTNGKWVSMAVPSDGSYGFNKGLWASVPVVCEAGEYRRVANVPMDPATAKLVEISHKELQDEKKAVKSMLGKALKE